MVPFSKYHSAIFVHHYVRRLSTGIRIYGLSQNHTVGLYHNLHIYSPIVGHFGFLSFAFNLSPILDNTAVNILYVLLRDMCKNVSRGYT